MVRQRATKAPPPPPPPRPPSASFVESAKVLLGVHVWTLAAVVVAVVCLAWTSSAGSGLDPRSSLSSTHHSDAARSLSDVATPPAPEDDSLAAYYASDLVRLDATHLLLPSDSTSSSCTHQFVPLNSTFSHVKTAMASTTRRNHVLLMLNGMNEGLYFARPTRDSCMHALGVAAAISLGVDSALVANGFRFVSAMGRPISSMAAAPDNIAHILLDFQPWVWPGIEVGHKYELENNVTLETVGLSPLVFSVSNFFTETEAKQIIAEGSPLLNRSRIILNGTAVESSRRTSNTAMLAQSPLTRAFQHRSAALARLPSPSFVSKLQLVRYEAGEFYRKHLDTMGAPCVLPPSHYALGYADYVAWVEWAAATCDSLQSKPLECRRGQPWFPALDNPAFEPTLLRHFVAYQTEAHFFMARSEESWASWILEMVDGGWTTVMAKLMAKRGTAYLPALIAAWNAKVQRRELRAYTPGMAIPVHGIAHFYRWTRWLKNQIAVVGLDKVPPIAHPTGSLYPKFSVAFQTHMAALVLRVVPNATLVEVLGDVASAAFRRQVGAKTKSSLLFALNASTAFVDIVIQTWEKEANVGPRLQYTKPKHARNWRPNRLVTLFMYLSDVDEGGETVFPYSVDAAVTRQANEPVGDAAMDECNVGLAVPPTKLKASLFYVQTPDEVFDLMSRHGGCPPRSGVKWGSNSFMMNADARETKTLYDV